MGSILFKNICGWTQKALFPASVPRHVHPCSCWTWFLSATKLFGSTLGPTPFSKTLWLVCHQFPWISQDLSLATFPCTKFDALFFLGHCQGKTFFFFQVKCLERVGRQGYAQSCLCRGGTSKILGSEYPSHPTPPFYTYTHTSPWLTQLLGWHFPSTSPLLRLVIPKPRAGKPQKIIGAKPIISFCKEDCI